MEEKKDEKRLRGEEDGEEIRFRRRKGRRRKTKRRQWYPYHTPVNLLTPLFPALP